ncbi:T9SS type A sorting domain-containing protein [Parvicella tangerina]|uniref:T9SS C-terminal target domain-containing protein n=1 Tax=Parvicella tangerina TaxID=2829795 RepID=A0A916JQG9_9FLAO|nr:T9SS type A sorting domain-containing protein [Parvicella tangerina]CAG5085927.1 hypothetical protein CRYO30217_02935 [Parvicella tangerina]
MKQLFTLLSLVLALNTFSQQTTHSFTWDGLTREYIKYVPASYDGSSAVPVVFCLHGLGDNMNNFTGIGMNYVADTANFIVITPQAIVDPLIGSSAWNSGASYLGYTLNGSVDDIGFFGAILDTLIADYNIDQSKVFSCGFSMGGFMTNRLGCEMNDRIAAIASVAGTIGGALNCTPGRAVPACHFHGTGDSTVYYEGNLYGNDAEDLATFWATNNNCGGTPTVTALPDIMSDGLTVTHSLYSSCDDGAEVELFRVDSAEHVWLTPANDIFYTTEIWKFFMKHSFESVSVDEVETPSFSVYPNPTNAMLQLELTEINNASIKLYDLLGNELINQKANALTESLDLGDLPSGTYFIKVVDNLKGLSTTQKVVLQH